MWGKGKGNRVNNEKVRTEGGKMVSYVGNKLVFVSSYMYF